MLQVRAISGALGAEVSGVDLSRALDKDTVAALRQAWLEHIVLFFRDQNLTPAQFAVVAQYFGTPQEYPFLEGLPEQQATTQVIKQKNETVNFGGVWHTDTTYLDHPPMATILIAREVPPVGGDTLFANMYRAYDTLSEGLKRLLGGLTAVHDSGTSAGAKTREDLLRDFGKKNVKHYFAEHPVVRTHSETGRKALFVDKAHVTRFKDMTEEESVPLLNFLFQHQTTPEFTCRFAWRPGSIALWDNRCAQHFAVNDYHGHRRVMHRITLAGDRPR